MAIDLDIYSEIRMTNNFGNQSTLHTLFSSAVPLNDRTAIVMVSLPLPLLMV